MMTTEEQGAASANAAAAAASSAEGPGTSKNVPAAEESESLSAREGQDHEGEAEAATSSSSPARTTARAATPTFTSAATPPTTSPSATSPTATGGPAASPMPPLPPPKTPSRISPADDEYSGDMHPMEVHGLRGPLPIIGAGPSRGGGGGGVVGAHHHPFALTPVIRNTSEQELGHHHDRHFHGADDGTGGDSRDAARKREQFLNLSVPASMGGKDDDDDDKHRRNSHSGLPAQLQQRPRRPPPQAAIHSAAAAAGPSMLMPASAPPIPPRVSNGGRGGGGPPSLLPAPNHRTAGGAAAASMPFLRMDGGGSGDARASAAAAPVLHRPPPAVRSHSAGNLDMHSMVQTIREHLSRQEREGRGLDDGDDEECEDEENIPQWAVEGTNGDGDEDAAQARLSEALESDWDVDRCRSLHRRPSPRALRGTAPMSKDPSQELVHQAGLPPPSILHPSLPLHEPEEQRLLAEPYRPNRENSFEVGVKRVDQKELDSIFKPDPRDHSADGSKGSPLPPPGSSSSSAFRGGNGDGGGPPMLRDLGGLQDLGSAAYHEEALLQQHQHQLPQAQCGQILKGSPLRHPNGNGGGSNGVHPVVIPPAVQLSDRDWSIPSIRLANRLRGESSLCSFASHEYGEDDDRTEEDNIYCYRNDGDFGEDEDAETLSTAGSLDVSHHRLPALVAVDEEQERPPTAQSAESSVSREGSRREKPTVLIEGGIIADALSSSSAAAPARPREESGSVSQDSGVAAVGGLTASSSAMGDLSVRSDAEAAAAQEEAGGAGETTSQEPRPQDSQQEPPTSTSLLPPPIAASAPIVSAGAEGSSTTSSSSPHHPRRGQRPQRHKPSSSSRESRNKEAIAWLRTVEVGGISEAASSKFLTGGVRAGLATAGAGAAPTAPAATRLKTGGSPGSVLLRPHPMSRVISSPAAACVSQTSS